MTIPANISTASASAAATTTAPRQLHHQTFALCHPRIVHTHSHIAANIVLFTVSNRLPPSTPPQSILSFLIPLQKKLFALKIDCFVSERTSQTNGSHRRQRVRNTVRFLISKHCSRVLGSKRTLCSSCLEGRFCLQLKTSCLHTSFMMK